MCVLRFIRESREKEREVFKCICGVLFDVA